MSGRFGEQEMNQWLQLSRKLFDDAGFVAISISPTQKDMIPIIMHSVIASLEESSAALVMSGMRPVNGVDNPKHHHTGPEIIEHKKTLIVFAL